MSKVCATCRLEQPIEQFRARFYLTPTETSCKKCRRKASANLYYRRHTAKARAAGKAYRASDHVREKRRIAAQVYRRAKRAELREKLREWRASNPEAARLQNIESAHVRRCRKAGVPVERFNRNAIFVRDKALCAYCGLGLDPLNWHLDHVVPISRGGGHTRQNVVASCPPCNLSKGAREVAA